MAKNDTINVILLIRPDRNCVAELNSVVAKTEPSCRDELQTKRKPYFPLRYKD
jgi:hypothetical protein